MRFFGKTVLLCALVLACGCSHNPTYDIDCQQKGSFSFQNGDLLFFDYDCGELCDAIEEVTQGFDGVNLSHVGIVEIEHGKAYIFEAVSEGVRRARLEDSIGSVSVDENGAWKVVVGRLKPHYQHLNEDAIEYARTLVGKDYNKPYLPDTDEYYCSELVYEAFKVAAGYDVFNLEPMTFKSPSSGEFFEAWIDYYSELGIDIPEGVPGINPGGISRSEKLVIYEPFGKCSRK